MRHLGAVVGLPIEAAILRMRAAGSISSEMIVVAGASATRAEALADGLVDRGAQALVSFGIAGGLDPDLKPGALVLATEVVGTDGARLGTSEPLRSRLCTRLKVQQAPLAGSDAMVAAVSEKERWRRETGAVAIDMESHGVACAAAKRGLPLLVLRAIADRADQALPPAATAGLKPDGSTDALAVVRALVGSPGQIPQLLGVTANTAAALLALWRAAPALNAL
jgi:adenosylhomocysteine nucleosidase